MRARFAIISLAACLLASATATAGVRKVKSLDGIDPGKRVRIEGVMSIRGSTPFTILVLEANDGEGVTLGPHSSDIEQALRNLDGMRVAVEGEVLAPAGPSFPQLRVERYEVLAPPGGSDPIVGTLVIEHGACVLTTDEDTRYWIIGDLAPALCEHAGARVWMVGKKAKHADGNRPPGSTPFTATGYGVIGN